jgi:hypothetical protein
MRKRKGGWAETPRRITAGSRNLARDLVDQCRVESPVEWLVHDVMRVAGPPIPALAINTS